MLRAQLLCSKLSKTAFILSNIIKKVGCPPKNQKEYDDLSVLLLFYEMSRWGSVGRGDPSPTMRGVEVAKRREGLKKQHGVLFFPERDRTAVRPSPPTGLQGIFR